MAFVCLWMQMQKKNSLARMLALVLMRFHLYMPFAQCSELFTEFQLFHCFQPVFASNSHCFWYERVSYDKPSVIYAVSGSILTSIPLLNASIKYLEQCWTPQEYVFLRRNLLYESNKRMKHKCQAKQWILKLVEEKKLFAKNNPSLQLVSAHGKQITTGKKNERIL